MAEVLILGGTGWVGREIAVAFLAAGHRVTCLARGESGEVPAGAELLRVDRRASDAYSAVDQDWDEIVEISWDLELVTGALESLATRATHWSLVSTISVYESDAQPGADETAAVVEPAELGEPQDYGQAKVAVERASGVALGDRLLIVRPGLIAGPGDRSDRFGYWVSRMALANSQPVLSMRPTERMSQVIDVRDLAAFVARATGTGAINAVGVSYPLTEALDRAARVAGFTGQRVEAEDDWLLTNDVNYWAGPRSLPLWLPAEDAAMMTRGNVAYLAAGGTIRDLDETLRDILVDETRLGLDRERRAGLARSDELELLAKLAKP
jgi:2'-hydroxyisoflavone reductase